MPTPSTIDQLNKEDRAWLEKRLLDKNFSDYDGLMALLQERGLEVSRSALGRFGKKYKDYVRDIRRSTDMAVMLSREVGDDMNAVGDATIRMMQVQLFDALQDYDFTKLQDAKPHQLISALADLNRATVGQKKWMADVKQRVKEVADTIEKTVEGAGASEESIALFRKEILGILE